MRCRRLFFRAVAVFAASLAALVAVGAQAFAQCTLTPSGAAGRSIARVRCRHAADRGIAETLAAGFAIPRLAAEAIAAFSFTSSTTAGGKVDGGRVVRLRSYLGMPTERLAW